MPKVLSYTPPWLSRPSPGYELFAPTVSKQSSQGKRTNCSSRSSDVGKPRRTIAHRGSEVFVATGNEIRWSDLVMLSENNKLMDLSRSSSMHSRARSREGSDPIAQSRTLKVPFSNQITQLSISPDGDYIAICTSHTVYISILPDSSHLGTHDSTPLKLKSFQLGPTAHVLEQSPLASVIWHPLGVQGRSLVTITEDGSIRLWEVDKDDRSSFSEPSFAINLQKLANAKSADADLRASVYGSGKAFSADMAELQVAAASFGSALNSRELDGWSSMTLWLATTGGDVYALCPLLPRRWQAQASLSEAGPLQNLGATIAAKRQLLSKESSAQEYKNAEAQKKWFADITGQIPTTLSGESLSRGVEVYTRPSKIPAIPKLQGPFELTPEVDMDAEAQICDIFVAPLKEAVKDFDLDLEDEEEEEEDITDIDGSLVLLSTTSGSVYCCLDLAGIEGQWLPPKLDVQAEDDNDEQTLMVVDTVILPATNNELAILFTPDVLSQHSVFVTHPHGVFYLSLSKWIQKVTSELHYAEEEGSSFRLDLLLDAPRTYTDPVVLLPSAERDPAHLANAIILEDSDLGYFLLFAASSQPFAATLDPPQPALHADPKLLEWSRHTDLPSPTLLASREPRLPYQPPAAFWKESQLLQFYDDHVPARQRRAFRDEIRLAPAALDVLTALHRILSSETHALGLAAADLFRRCERLQDEFREQIQRAAELNGQVDGIVGGVDDDSDDESRSGVGSGSGASNDLNSEEGEDDDDEDDDELVTANTKLEKRIRDATQRQADLTARHAAIKARLARASHGHALSAAESAFAGETTDLAASICIPASTSLSQPADAIERCDDDAAILSRFEDVQRLQKELLHEAQGVVKRAADAGGQETPSRAERHMASPVKRAKVAQVMELLERETALVDATAGRLGRLSLVPL